jgi:hypothetical protein
MSDLRLQAPWWRPFKRARERAKIRAWLLAENLWTIMSAPNELLQGYLVLLQRMSDGLERLTNETRNV